MRLGLTFPMFLGSNNHFQAAVWTGSSSQHQASVESARQVDLFVCSALPMATHCSSACKRATSCFEQDE